MKRFACGDVVPGCDAVFTRATTDEILADVASHAAAGHGMTEVPPELASAVMQRIVVVG